MSATTTASELKSSSGQVLLPVHDANANAATDNKLSTAVVGTNASTPASSAPVLPAHNATGHEHHEPQRQLALKRLIGEQTWQNPEPHGKYAWNPARQKQDLAGYTWVNLVIDTWSWNQKAKSFDVYADFSIVTTSVLDAQTECVIAFIGWQHMTGHGNKLWVTVLLQLPRMENALLVPLGDCVLTGKTLPTEQHSAMLERLKTLNIGALKLLKHQSQQNDTIALMVRASHNNGSHHTAATHHQADAKHSKHKRKRVRSTSVLFLSDCVVFRVPFMIQMATSGAVKAVTVMTATLSTKVMT